LASQRDVRALLAAILRSARQMTGADAGSVYVVERPEPGTEERLLHFMLSQNDSVAIDFSERTLTVDGKSIVGAAVIGREPINIPDLYALDFDQNPYGFQHDRSFDQRTGYATRSMLTVPMSDAQGDVIGVIQLINKKRDPARRLRAATEFDAEVVPFDAPSVELARALAAQAGVSLENALLYQEVRELFEGFVHASVMAIESRDPTTSGHSQRVATLTVGLARVVDGIADGPLVGWRFSVDDLKELEYAGLLHDFGKVGVREKVLVKAKKLYEPDRMLIQARFDYIRSHLESEHLRRKTQAPREAWPALEAELASRLEELDRFGELVAQANEPAVLPQGGGDTLAELGARSYRTPRGEERPYLEAEEIVALSIPRGSLTERERVEIESHVTHTYNFLRKIPWGRQFRNVPAIAGAHHEKLDGSGYPRGLHAPAIPIGARMMAISDIYDALTASDRPYKRAIPTEKALAIIESEVKAGKCDADLFRVFVEAGVYRLVRA
jgi:HD-GYP domain-containing protein (c-di-GMP phosphodiesterase class II)